MQCEKCRAELPPNSISCPECGAPALQTIEGFDNTQHIQLQLKNMFREYADSLFLKYQGSLMFHEKKFTALLNDFIAEYDKERKLLRSMVEEGILGILLTEQGNRDMAATKARSIMLGEKFLSENAAEFVLASLTYMIGWPYESPLRVPDKTDQDNEPKERTRPVSVNDNVFSRAAAAKFRFLSRNVVIPDGSTKIEEFSFDGFGNLRSVQLPDSLLAIGEYAFSNCKHLRLIELPASLRLIGQSAFSQCEKLVSINLPSGIMEIADSTFAFCKSLEIVEIPDTVSSIGEQAFAGCERLRKLTLPDSVKFIDKNAFAYCPRLTIVCVENSYVYKYCLSNAIPVEKLVPGTR